MKRETLMEARQKARDAAALRMKLTLKLETASEVMAAQQTLKHIGPHAEKRVKVICHE